MIHDRPPPHILPGILAGLLLLLPAPGLGAQADGQREEENKALARRFYEEVWFSRNMSAVDELVASEYVVHDIGDRKAVVEPADEQVRIADFLWKNGNMGGHIDFQIADGDLVATRWQWDYEPTSLLMKAVMLGGRRPVPVINVFRFEDGKIVEIWNHRHDIDVGFAANALRAQGFGAGVVTVIVLLVGVRLVRRRRR